MHDDRGYGLVCLAQGSTAAALDRMRSEWLRELRLRAPSKDKHFGVDRLGNEGHLDQESDRFLWTTGNRLYVISGKRSRRDLAERQPTGLRARARDFFKDMIS